MKAVGGLLRRLSLILLSWTGLNEKTWSPICVPSCARTWAGDGGFACGGGFKYTATLPIELGLRAGAKLREATQAFIDAVQRLQGFWEVRHLHWHTSGSYGSLLYIGTRVVYGSLLGPASLAQCQVLRAINPAADHSSSPHI